MTSPLTPTVGVQLPPKTPKWVIHLIATAVALVPIILALWQPRDTFTTPASQATVILAGLALATVIFVVTVASENIAHYGLTKAALAATVTASEAELRQLLPEARSLFDTAKPLVESLGGANDVIQSLSDDVAGVKAKLDQVPAGQRQAALEALQSVWGATMQTAGGATVTTGPPPPAPAVIEDPRISPGPVADPSATASAP